MSENARWALICNWLIRVLDDDTSWIIWGKRWIFPKSYISSYDELNKLISYIRDASNRINESDVTEDWIKQSPKLMDALNDKHKTFSQWLQELNISVIYKLLNQYNVVTPEELLKHVGITLPINSLECADPESFANDLQNMRIPPPQEPFAIQDVWHPLSEEAISSLEIPLDIKVEVLRLTLALLIKVSLSQLKSIKDPREIFMAYLAGWAQGRLDCLDPDTALIPPDTLKDHLFKLKSSESRKKGWEEHDKAIDEALREADQKWASGDKSLHNQMANHLARKFGLKRSVLLRRVKDVARKYNRVFGIKGIKKEK